MDVFSFCYGCFLYPTTRRRVGGNRAGKRTWRCFRQNTFLQGLSQLSSKSDQEEVGPNCSKRNLKEAASYPQPLIFHPKHTQLKLLSLKYDCLVEHTHACLEKTGEEKGREARVEDTLLGYDFASDDRTQGKTN